MGKWASLFSSAGADSASATMDGGLMDAAFAEKKIEAAFAGTSEESSVTPTETAKVLAVTAFATAIAAAGSGLVGSYLVTRMRNPGNVNTAPWKLTLPILVTPLVVLVALVIATKTNFCNKFFADAVTFSLVAGIVSKLSVKQEQRLSVKLHVLSDNDKNVQIVVDTPTVKVGEVRNKIAEKMKISPASRINIESGKGNFVEDLSKPFFQEVEVDVNKLSKDFFGMAEACCFVHVSEDRGRSCSLNDGQVDGSRIGVSRRGSFAVGMLKDVTGALAQPFKSSCKYGNGLTLLAKGIKEGQGAPFLIRAVDRFASATPSVGIVNPGNMRMRKWMGATDGDSASEAETSAAGTPRKSLGEHSHTGARMSFLGDHGFLGGRRPSIQHHSDGQPIRSGDEVVIECDGKYMSVTKGWWIAWGSSEPRRSGAYIVEILERSKPSSKMLSLKPSLSLGAASQMGIGINSDVDTTKHSMESAGEAGSPCPQEDATLRPGDTFRLRSVKFPDFELGVTHTRLRDDFFYMGLKKINDTHTDNWCMSVRFTVKSNML